MITIIILIVIYLLSAYGHYKWIQEAYYSKNRCFTISKPNTSDLFSTFLPIINTISCIALWLFISPYKDKETHFFKPKNK